MDLNAATRGVRASFLNKYSTWVFDCDGVLWRGGEAVKGAGEWITALKEAGKTVLFVTNNSTTSRAGYVSKLDDRLGLKSIDEKTIFSSSYAVAAALIEAGFKKGGKYEGKSAYIIGQKGIVDECALAGISTSGGEPEGSDRNKVGDIAIAVSNPDPNVGAVLAGFDAAINYQKLAHAQAHLTARPDSEDVLFLATNTDHTFPAGSQRLPGGGTVIAALEYCTRRKATVCGKPSSTLMDIVRRDFPSVAPGQAVMVGDRPETDIQWGNEGGLDTILVYSGVTHRAPGLTGDATYVIDSLGDFTNALGESE